VARATIIEFAPAHGIGKVRLDTGEIVTFDVTVADARDLRVGETGEATIGTGYKGRPKVTRLVVRPNWRETALPLADGVAALHRKGLLLEWDESHCRELVDTADSVTVDGFATLLAAYYGLGPTPRSTRERFLVLEAENLDTTALVGALAGMARTGEPLMVELDASGSAGSLVDRAGRRLPFDDPAALVHAFCELLDLEDRASTVFECRDLGHLEPRRRAWLVRERGFIRWQGPAASTPATLDLLDMIFNL